MAPGALRFARHARSATLAAVLAVAAICFAHSFSARPVSAATPPDLAITITDSTDPVAANQKYSYTVTVSNIGGSTAGTEIDPQTNGPVGVRVLENLPLGFVTNSFLASGGGVCQLAPPNPFEILTCQFAPFVPGQVETIMVSGAVSPGGASSVLNRAFVDLPVSRTSEAIEVYNNIADQTTQIVQPTATPTREPPSLGGVADYPDARSGTNAWLIADVAGAAGLILFSASWWVRRRAR